MERVERLGRPFHRRHDVLQGEAFDLAHAVLDDRAAQGPGDRNRPEGGDVMRPDAGDGDGDIRMGRAPGRVQARDEVFRGEGRVAGQACDMGEARRDARAMVEPSENAGQGPAEIRADRRRPPAGRRDRNGSSRCWR